MQRNPFSELPPLQLSPLPPQPLDQQRLAALDRQRSTDPLYRLVRQLGLRPVEAAGLRPLDFSRVANHPVLWIRSWHLASLSHPCPHSNRRCLPMPSSLLDLWQSCSGTGLEPLWGTSGQNPRLLARRWGEQLRRSSGISATALRLERRRLWMEAGADAVALRQLLGGGSPRPDQDADVVLQLLPWIDVPPLDLSMRMLHCPTEPAALAICA